MTFQTLAWKFSVPNIVRGVNSHYKSITDLDMVTVPFVHI